MYLKYKYFVISINTKPVHKQIQVWPEVSSEALQDCCNATGWNMFKQAATYNNTTDLQEYSETVTAYITKCIDDVTGHEDHHCPGQPEAVAHGGGLHTPEVLQEDNPSFQRQQRHSEPMAGDSDHYGLQAPLPRSL